MKGLKGSVNQRGANYQALLSYKKEDGTWGKRSKACKTKTEALGVLKEWNHEETLGMAQDNPTLETVRDSWLREKRLSGADNSILAYENTSNYIIKHLNKPIKNVTRDDIVEFFFTIKEEGLEITYFKSVLSMIFNYAISKKIVASNPVLGIRTTRTKEKREPVILNDERRAEILEKTSGTLFYYLIAIGLLVGMRKGELLGLKWKYVNLDNETIEVAEQHTATGQTTELKSKKSYRVIELDEASVFVFNELKDSEFTDSEYVFADHEKAYVAFYTECRKYGIVPHDLRHNHATDLLEIMNHADAANRMGHTVEEYVKTYVHSSSDSRKRAIAKLNLKNKNLFGNKIVTSNVIKFAKR